MTRLETFLQLLKIVFGIYFVIMIYLIYLK